MAVLLKTIEELNAESSGELFSQVAKASPRPLETEIKAAV
jgi:hypothetical protein